MFIFLVEGDNAVQDLVFLEQRTKSKHSASLVASGPAGRWTYSLPIQKENSCLLLQATFTFGISMMLQSLWPASVL